MQVDPQMHHARVRSMTSEDQDHDHDYSDDSFNEAFQGNGSTAKRRRVSQSWVNVSCQLCKTRKVKCDRTLPSCGWCTRNNAACEYKERKKPGLRAGYGRELEQRLDKLEGILLQHSEVLARVLGQVPNCEETRWDGNEIDNAPSKYLYTFSQRQAETSTSTAPMNGLYESSCARRESIGTPYSTSQVHREYSQSLPPITTASPTHNRRPSVSFMNNPTSSPPFYVKPSQSPPALTHGVLKHHVSSPQYVPLLTPNTTPFSGSHSPQHDYIGSEKQRRNQTATSPPPAQSLQERYPFNNSLSGYTNEPLPPWPVMYELALLYFKHINAVLPLISEKTVFEVILDPCQLDDGTRAILMSIPVVAMRFLSATHLSSQEKEHYARKCREELSRPEISRSRDGMKALAVLLLGSNGNLGSDETAEILGHVNARLSEGEKWRMGSEEQRKLSVSEMLCRS